MLSDDQIVDIFKDLIKIKTVNPPGNEKEAVDYLVSILEKEKINYDVIEKEEKRTNIVAYIGEETNLEPILFISHLDVVPADDEGFLYPPFSATEVDGMIYGRGTLDTKHLTAMALATLIRYKNVKLNRRVYFVATANEEQGSAFGMPDVIEKYKDKFKNSIVINEGGGFYVQNGSTPYYVITVGEKGRCNVRVNITGTPGATSMPTDNSVVAKFVEFMKRLTEYEFNKNDSVVYRKFISSFSEEITNPMLIQFENYISYDKFILPKYDLGEQINVLPKKMEFDFSIQLMPYKTVEDAKRIIEELVKGLDVNCEIIDFTKGFESSCENISYELLSQIVKEKYEGAKLLPIYALGRTDGRFFGDTKSDVYGFSPVNKIIPFELVIRLVHQNNERIDRNSIIKGTEIYMDFVGCLGGVEN